ncbi:PREDICTED: zinc transporter ZIP11 isoform X1 [Corvus brachyrhynchos]|uniref:zinc transporter ZIP11 isoform X1 n=1 Tax=Corvus brachyrhynchos TaxID=85066 RepID=UPI0008165106|nr:PREDICTED: zinc transporter ZIP11 isoform X1 [Corvus brachyrhynchos]
MIPGSGPVVQALLGTFLTWGLTAAGSALVFVFSSGQRRILDGSLGFAAGVMLAASYWSLLAPAIEMAEESGTFGAFSFFPVAAGFALGAAFVYGADLLIPVLGFTGPSHAALALSCDQRAVKEKQEQAPGWDVGSELSIRIGRAGLHPDKAENGEPYQRRRGAGPPLPEGPPAFPAPRDGAPAAGSSSWRRIMLMILAITIHNIPEGLAVGVGFGAIGKSASATFQSARNLAIGIGIQNFPEGLAVSLPLRGAGFSTWKAFWSPGIFGLAVRQVRAAERDGGAPGRCLRRLRRGAGGAAPALRAGIRRRSHGLRGDGRHHSRGTDQRQREVGILDLHPGICGDDVPGCGAGIRALLHSQEKTSEPRVLPRDWEPDTRYPGTGSVHRCFGIWFGVDSL